MRAKSSLAKWFEIVEAALVGGLVCGPIWKLIVAKFASGEYNPTNRHGAVADVGRIVMGIRFSGTLLAAVTAGFVVAPALSALAQFSPSGFGGAGQATGQGKSNTTDRMGGGGGKGATARTTTVKSSKSNTSDRMGGGGGTKAGGAANRMGGGGGGKGGVQLNPQPEPPGRAKY